MTIQAMIASFVVVIITGLTLIYSGIQGDFTPLILGGLVVLIGGTIAIFKKISWFILEILNSLFKFLLVLEDLKSFEFYYERLKKF